MASQEHQSSMPEQQQHVGFGPQPQGACNPTVGQLSREIRDLDIEDTDSETYTGTFTPSTNAETLSEVDQRISNGGQHNTLRLTSGSATPTPSTPTTPTISYFTTPTPSMTGHRSTQRERDASPDDLDFGQLSRQELLNLRHREQRVDEGAQPEESAGSTIPTQTPILGGLGRRSNQRERDASPDDLDFGQLTRQQLLNVPHREERVDEGGQRGGRAFLIAPGQAPALGGLGRRSNRREQNTAPNEGWRQLTVPQLNAMHVDDEADDEGGQPEVFVPTQRQPRMNLPSIQRNQGASPAMDSNQRGRQNVRSLRRRDHKDYDVDKKLRRDLADLGLGIDVSDDSDDLDHFFDDSDESYHAGGNPPRAHRGRKLKSRSPSEDDDFIPDAESQGEPFEREEDDDCPSEEMPDSDDPEREDDDLIINGVRQGDLRSRGAKKDDDDCPSKEMSDSDESDDSEREDDDLIINGVRQGDLRSQGAKEDDSSGDSELEESGFALKCKTVETSRHPYKKPRALLTKYEAASDSDDYEGMEHSPVRMYKFAFKRPDGSIDRCELRLQNKPKPNAASTEPNARAIKRKQFILTEEGVMMPVDTTGSEATIPRPIHSNEQEPPMKFHREPCIDSEWPDKRTGPIVGIIEGARRCDGWCLFVSPEEFSQTEKQPVIVHESEGTIATDIRLMLRLERARNTMLRKRLRVSFFVSRLQRNPAHLVGWDVEFVGGEKKKLWEPVRQLVKMVWPPDGAAEKTKGKKKVKHTKVADDTDMDGDTDMNDDSDTEEDTETGDDGLPADFDPTDIRLF